jgi:hypothetical protein
LATFVWEGVDTGFRFHYAYSDLGIGSISRHLLASLIMSTVLAALLLEP